ncbi:hypothetical protein AX14_006596 [Amanita brunnescens Koide BX004]|nr:hypothetical protein AX14_006596 [Amanita brunnescens Koide BX004]
MPYYTVAPRPILKRHDHPSPTPSPSHHAVHFPPSPALTRIFSAHSPAAYDRSPIVITPNSCTLPERGCPGRTYYSAEESARAGLYMNRANNARAVHPRTLSYQSRPCDIPPPLVPDLSSESEESDGFTCSFFEPPAQNHNAYNASGLAVNIARHDACYTSIDEKVDALSFLPHSPSPSPLARSYVDDEEASLKARRRRPSRERKHDSSRNPDRIRSETGRSESPNHRGRRRQSSKTRSSDRALSICNSFASLDLKDDGCLGGF